MLRFLYIINLFTSIFYVRGQVINTIAGTGSASNTGDGNLATIASLQGPSGIAVDAFGNIYISSFNCIRKINTSGNISTIAGSVSGAFGYTGNGGPAISALLHAPGGIAIDGAGNIYVAEFLNHCIRKINTSGIISTVAGNGTQGFSGDGGPATSANLNNPTDVAVDASGNIYIADGFNYRIRKVSSLGTISTIAGTGVNSFSGDGGLAASASMGPLYGIVIDASSNIYISDYNNRRVRKINNLGIISTIVGTGVLGNSGDGGPATSAQIGGPRELRLDNTGNLFIPDYYYSTIRKVDPLGNITTVTGNGMSGFGGDGGLASLAQIDSPFSNATDSNGDLYITDSFNNRIRKINLNTKVNEQEIYNTVNIFPNPVSDVLYFKNNKLFGNSEMEITNCLGQSILKARCSNSLDVTQFSPGVYTIKIMFEDKNYFKIFVKE